MSLAMVAVEARQMKDPISFTLAIRAAIEGRFSDRMAPMGAVRRAEILQTFFEPSVDELSPTFFAALEAMRDFQRRHQP